MSVAHIEGYKWIWAMGLLMICWDLIWLPNNFAILCWDDLFVDNVSMTVGFLATAECAVSSQALEPGMSRIFEIT